MVGEVLQTRFTPSQGKENPFSRERMAITVSDLYQQWNKHRRKWLDERIDLQNYLFATDTSTTQNQSLPWKNKTTLPKLTQIRDALSATYMAALFPNDNWMTWIGATPQAAKFEKKKAITAYMKAKIEMSDFYQTMAKLIDDYIDYGNAIATVEWVSEATTDPETGMIVTGYVGPRVIRISPTDIVWNPTASSFKRSTKITRELMNFGEFYQKALEGNMYDVERLERLKQVRGIVMEHTQNTLRSTYFTPEDYDKAVRLEIDGFGTMYDYWRSGYIELLKFEGSLYDELSNTYMHDMELTIVDRSYVLTEKPIPSWQRGGLKAHAGWRNRPDNIYAMGPLDNLVGMQYRIDHLENIKADVFDLIAFPPLKIKGSVEEFVWGPGEEIHLDDPESDVQMMTVDSTALRADTQIALLEQKMEEFAGVAREAIGMRTPGEKTAFEVQQLGSASNRLFQNKIQKFEKDLLEPILNGMLELAVRNMDVNDVVGVMNENMNIREFMTLSRDQLIAPGTLRPIGARRFAAQAQLLQNLAQLTGTNVWPVIQPHVSGKRIAKLIEESLELDRYALFEDNIAVMEQMETQQLIQTAQDTVLQEGMTPVEDEDI